VRNVIKRTTSEILHRTKEKKTVKQSKEWTIKIKTNDGDDDDRRESLVFAIYRTGIGRTTIGRWRARDRQSGLLRPRKYRVAVGCGGDADGLNVWLRSYNTAIVAFLYIEPAAVYLGPMCTWVVDEWFVV